MLSFKAYYEMLVIEGMCLVKGRCSNTFVDQDWLDICGRDPDNPGFILLCAFRKGCKHTVSWFLLQSVLLEPLSFSVFYLKQKRKHLLKSTRHLPRRKCLWKSRKWVILILRENQVKYKNPIFVIHWEMKKTKSEMA